jgi:hypothetical protein
MTQARAAPSTGIPALDGVVGGLLPGDNVVWAVEAIEDYAQLVVPFVARALADGRRVVYFRFARHAPLVEEGRGAETHRLHPSVGFERFTAAIQSIIARAGEGGCYVFDCLSDLAADWSSDVMLGNFFVVTCPCLGHGKSVASFALLRGAHSAAAVDAIRENTQLLVDLFRHRGTLYVHPLKVHERHAPTMYLPHAWRDGKLRPLTESALLAEALDEVAERRVDPLAGMDVWERRFLAAREAAEGARRRTRPESDVRDQLLALLGMIFTRDAQLADLATRYLDLDDLFAIRRRMIGTGLVGGKAVGMLLARAILVRTDPAWRSRLEPHDAWFIGSDVFTTYLVRNGLWRSRRGRQGPGSLLEGAEEARRGIQMGSFPEFVERQFVTMLESYGQSPIVVRSSSLLEDGFGNAFAGKYESVFCANQGSPAERLAAFTAAVKAVYASTLSEAALGYRARRGLLAADEQMGILVQRVSGAVHGRYFYPQISGVALSWNPYVWSPEIDPAAGVVRLVLGLGTRAVDRSDGDYTRVAALNAPTLRPESSLEEVARHAQRDADVIDLEGGRFTSVPIGDLVAESPGLPLDLFASPRSRAGQLLTFERLLGETEFAGAMRSLLRTLREAYEHPVDVEFTANQLSTGALRVNVLRCRPLQEREGGAPPARTDGGAGSVEQLVGYLAPQGPG